MTLGDLAVDHYSPVPLYHQIAEKIRSGVEARELAVGQSLGSEKRLANEVGVSLPTIRKAFEILASEGIVIRKPGLGTFLSDPSPPNLVKAVALDPNHRGSMCRLASLEKVKPEHGIRERMGLSAECGVWRLLRIHEQGDKPVAVLENFLLDEPSTSNLLRLESSGAGVALMSPIKERRSVHYEIKALEAEGRLAQELRIMPGTPVIILEQTVHRGDGEPIEFATHSYLASHHRFEATLSPSRGLNRR